MDGNWIRKPKGETSVVFVHGIFSDGEKCWTHNNGTYWPNLLKDEKGLETLGIYVFSYKTGFFSRDYNLSDAVDSLKEHLRTDEVIKSKRIIFVCHSMGGIVVRKYIVDRAPHELMKNNIDLGLFLIASPSLGSEYANWLKPLAKLLKNSHGDALRFHKKNAWLKDLDNNFFNIKESGRPAIHGKELIEDKPIVFKKFNILKRVVEPISGARYFGNPFKVPDSDHLSIATPENDQSTQHGLLCTFIKDLPLLSTPKREVLHHEPIGSQSPQKSLIHSIPHRRNPYFTGRDSILENLQNALTAQKTAAVTQAINGLGGIGKTQIAVEYFYRFKEKYNVVWWLKSEDRTTLSNDYVRLATELHLPECEVPDQSIVIDAVKKWLDKNNHWLLIFDNANLPGDLHPFIPSGQSGHIIITSRHKEWGNVANNFPLSDFERNESIDFLCKRTKSKDRTSANELAELLGDLPLALAQAAGYIVSTPSTVIEYISLFKAHRGKLLKRKDSESQYPDSVSTTWSLSLNQAKNMTPLAEELLKLITFFAPENIPRKLLRDGMTRLQQIDELGFNDAVGALYSNSLIEATPDTVSVHRLVQVVTSEQIEINEKKQYIQTAVQVMDEAFSSLPAQPNDVRSWTHCALLLPHAITVISKAAETTTLSSDLGSLMNWCGMYLRGRARYAEAEPMYRRALEINESQFGVDHPSVATSLNNLAELLRAQGKYAEAEPMHRRALEINESQLGVDHPSVATSLNNLAELLREQGKYAEAEPMHRRALEIKESQLEADHPSIATSLNNLALLLEAQGKYAEAEPMYRRALTILENVFGNDHPNTITLRKNLELFLEEQKKR